MTRNRQLSVRRLCGVAILSLIPAFACAVEQPNPFSFDAGPLGTLELSGGADGYAYAVTGTGDDLNKGLLGTSTSTRASVSEWAGKTGEAGGTAPVHD